MASDFQALINIGSSFNAQGINDASKGINKLKNDVSSLESNVDQITKGFKTLAASLAAKEIFDYAKSIIEFGADIGRMSEKVGIGAEFLNGFTSAAKTVDIELDTVKNSLKKFSVNVVEAFNGVTASQGAFKALGISVKDSSGNLRSNEAILKDVANAFKASEDGAAKTALALQIFGKTGADLVPVLNKGSEGIAGLGLKMSTDFVKRAHEASESFERVGLRIKEVGIDVIGKFLPAIQLVSSGLEKFVADSNLGSDALNGMAVGLKLVAAVGVSVYTALANGFDTVYFAVSAVVEALTAMYKQAVDAYGIVDGVLEGLTGNFQKAKAAFSKYGSDAIQDFKEYRQIIGKETEEYFQRVEKRAKAADDFIKGLQLLASPEKDRAATKPTSQEDKTGDRKLRVDEASDRLKREREEIDKFIQKKTAEQALRKEELENNTKLSVNLKNLRQIKEFQNEVENRTIGLTKSSADALKEKSKAIEEAIVANQKLEEQQKRTFGQGASEAFKEYVENARNVARQVKDLFTGAFTKIEDQFVNFVKTGKVNFAEFASFVEEQLIRIAFRQAVVAAVGTAVGFADGGIMTQGGPMTLHKYASGGVADRPQIALFGEGSRPEAFVPLPDGRTIPVTMKGAGVGGGTSVVVNVNIDKSGSSSEATSSDSQGGKNLGAIIATAVKQEISNQKRPGGLLYG